MIPRRLLLGLGGLGLLAACQTPPAGPRRALPEDGTIDLLSLLRDKPEHSRFTSALLLSGLESRLGRQNGAVTFFVPANDAFDALAAETRALLDNPPANPTAEQRQRMAALVSANAAWGLLRLADIAPRRGQVTTWDRARLQVAQTGERSATIQRVGVQPVAGRAPVQILRADVLASDGVFHVTSAPILSAA